MLKNGVPSEATLCRVDNGINDCAMADRMQEFVSVSCPVAERSRREIICVDGKAAGHSSGERAKS